MKYLLLECNILIKHVDIFRISSHLQEYARVSARSLTKKSGILTRAARILPGAKTPLDMFGRLGKIAFTSTFGEYSWVQ